MLNSQNECVYSCLYEKKNEHINTFLHIPVVLDDNLATTLCSIFFSHYLYLCLDHLGRLTCISLFCICSDAVMSVILNEKESFLCANHEHLSLATRVTGNLHCKAIWHTTAPTINSVLSGTARAPWWLLHTVTWWDTHRFPH